MISPRVRRASTFPPLVILPVTLSACALLRGPEPAPEPPPRECEVVNEGRLPSVDALLDLSELGPDLAAIPAEEDDLLITVAVRVDGTQLSIYPTDARAGEGAGLWPVVIRDALRSPLPEEASPAVRIRLTPGPEGGVELESSLFCPPLLENRDEVVERYLYQTRDLDDPGQVVAHLRLSELGGIQELEVEVPPGREELDLLARRALHFARFRPALLDGRAFPFTVTLEIP